MTGFRVACLLRAATTWFWNALRLSVAGLLLTFVLLLVAGAWKSQISKEGNYVPSGPIVCGRFSGETYDFPLLYFPLWPEYKGRSSFDPGFIYNKKGCGADFSSVALSMTWPELAPADDSWFFQQGLEHEGLLVEATQVGSVPGHLDRRLDFLLRHSPGKALESATYNKLIGLFWLEVEAASFAQNKRVVYWDKGANGTRLLIACDWRARTSSYYSCQMSFIAFGEIFIDVTMLPDKLSQWREVRNSIEEFFINSRKVEVGDVHTN
ncbi:hypothetical protein HCG45_05450 [Pseudomonas fulva]|uniref:hypothetical protein n=1 Tax=Pseudomonas fulva TaxID=47880 RepID=UPI001428970A|nr:hypothetical protein [Pseudomonas fulva]NIX92186.1 hypothetical protein [Pseudomonas fulva]